MASCGASKPGRSGAISRTGTASDVIAPKSKRKAVILWSKRIYRERNRIERMIGHLKVSRAVATRYDKLADPSSTPFISQPSASPYV